MAQVRINPNAIWQNIAKDPDWLHKVGIGGAINALCLLLIATNFLLLPLAFLIRALLAGYLLRAMRERLEDNQTILPKWNNFIELFFSGLTWLAVESLLYIALSLLTYLAIMCWDNSSSLSPSLAILTSVLMSIVIASLWLIVSFCLPFLMAIFAQEERFEAGFAFRRALGKAFSEPGTFIACWLLILGLQVAAIIVPLISIIGIFLMPTTIFFSQLMAANLAAQAIDRRQAAVAELS